MDEEEHHPDEFYYPEDLEQSNGFFSYVFEQCCEKANSPSNSQEQIEAFIADQRSVNTRMALECAA